MRAVRAVIPVKRVKDAKQRLASVLNASERRDLFVAMFEDVLDVVTAVQDFQEVTVATVCPTAREIAKRHGASVLSTGRDEGQTMAVANTAVTLEAEGVISMLMLPGDIPLLTVKEIRTVLDAHEKKTPAMTIVPARDELGSNCIVLSPPTAIPLCFGPNSYFPHLKSARRLGLVPQTPKLPGIGLDIDTLEDLSLLCHTPGSTRSQEYLQDQRIVERLGDFDEVSSRFVAGNTA